VSASAAGVAQGHWPARLRGRIGPPALDARVLLVGLAWTFLSVIVGLALFVLYMTFVPRLPFQPGLTLDNWARIASPYLLTRVLPNTAGVGVGAVLVGLAFAAPLAWILNRTRLPLRDVFVAAIAAGVMIPGFVRAMGWLILINERIGLLNRPLADLLGWPSVPLNLQNPFGMAWIIGLSLVPTLFFLLAGPMRMLDPCLEEAASMSGAGRLSTLAGVSLPLVWPAVLGGGIYAFMTAVSMFDVPALLGAAGGQVPVLAAELFYAVHPSNQSVDVAYGAAGVYGALIAGPSLIGLYVYFRVLERGRRYAVITGKGYRPRDVELGGLATAAAIGFVLLYLACALGLPLLVLVWASLLPSIQFPSMEALGRLSLFNYDPDRLLPNLGGPDVVWNTLRLTVWVPLVLVLFSIVISWVVVRTDAPLRHAMDTIAMLPHAVPGLAFAFALFMLSIVLARWSPTLSLDGTLGILVLANILSHLAFTTRVTNAALVQVSAELEECARVHGAGPLATLRRVLLPLIRPSLIYAGMWTAMLTFREVSMALFLTGPRNQVLSVGVWLLWQQGKFNAGAASAVLMVLATGVLFVGASLIARRARGFTGFGVAR
jgi:iron(III) transport system permease protein